MTPTGSRINRRQRAGLAGAGLALCLAHLASTGRAVVPHEPELAKGAHEMLAPFPRIGAEIDDRATAAWAAADPAWQAFLLAHPGRWNPRWDRRSDRMAFAWGEGIPWHDGRLRVSTPSERSRILDVIERRARAFIADNAELYRVPAGVDFVRDAARSGEIDGGRVWYLRLQARVRGVPVEGGIATFNLNAGRLVQFGLGGIVDDMAQAPTEPIVPASEAAARARAAIAKALGRSVTEEEFIPAGEARLFLLPWSGDLRAFAGTPGRGFELRLAWQQAFRVRHGIETWMAVHDAMSGERLALYDDNKYACPPPAQPRGRVVGGVFLGPIEEDPESLRPMPFASVSNGGPINADFNGTYPYAVGQGASTSLSGRFVDMSCTGCSLPEQAFAEVAAWGNLSLGTGGDDTIGNGLSTKAERNCFYHLNVVRQLASAHLTDAQVGGYFSRTMPAVVNIDATCNANWNGTSVNFFRAGGRCNNIGEIRDVIQHEWGHGLDQFTGRVGDGARGEGFSDVVAFLSTHDPRLAPYFNVGDPSGIRNADEDTGLYTRTNLTTHCGPPGAGGGPLGYEVHCEGVLSSQTWWHLARLLRAKYGEAGGWYAAERLFFQHMLVSHWSVYQNAPGGEVVQYDGVVLVDDDNGNLADGVPNGAEIDDAFTHHEIAGTPLVGDSSECLAPPTPPVGLTSALHPGSGLWQVHVTWPAVPLATRYQVLRNDGGGGAHVVVGTVFPPASEFFDDDVADGAVYDYRVQVFDSLGCLSTGDNRRTIALGPLVGLVIAGHAIDDAGPLANANGAAEPGETLILAVDVHDPTAGGASNVVATLSTTAPGVTVLDDTAVVGDVAAGATITTQAPHFTVRLDAAVACGSTIPFLVEMEAAEGCAVSAFRLEVGRRGAFLAEWDDDFEQDLGWLRIPPPGGRTPATAGLWIRADPNPTNMRGQLGDDHTPDPGVLCWVTGNDPDPQRGVDDVDGGCTTLLGPIVDLGGQAGLLLEYWRFLNIATVEDELIVEISNDGGSNWIRLETVVMDSSAFVAARFDLDGVLGGPANQVRLRFTACDLGSRSLLEAMLDDVRIGTQGFTCEPPDARPRLSFVSASIGDSPALGGDGNADGIVDPGEIVRVPIELANGGNATATRVNGTMTLVGAPAGVLVTDSSSTWPDIVQGASAATDGSPPHFEIGVPRSVACGGLIAVHLSVVYDGPAGSYALDQDITFEIGVDVVADVWSDDFEGGDNGFTHGWSAVAGCPDACVEPGCDDWHHLAPSGASSFDPAAAHSGSLVWANDVGGSIGGDNWNGEYNACIVNHLESPPIDCTGITGTRLGFWRWLTIQGGGFDVARVLVNANVVWEVPAAPAPFIDSAWTWVEYDISVFADGNPSVIVRFELESNDGAEFGGWTLDDMKVFTRDRICNPYGSGCVSPPLPGPVGPFLRATPDYGPTNAEYTWAGAPRRPDESWVFERTTGFRPAPSWTTLNGPGFTATTFDDATASGPRFYYRVVLENCAGERGPDSP